MTTSRQELFCVDVDNVRQVVLGAECRKVHIVYEKDWLTSDNESLTEMHDMTSRETTLMFIQQQHNRLNDHMSIGLQYNHPKKHRHCCH